ncbi:transcriptional regulator [Lactobacillus nasalidis]|uniref:Transcriptional regulator n=1 Tax=Lactobacillus nasalidis TaxID=2797258 RepID=A0ABQ3W7R3_9LACO|nr:helix-turn-helix transcriptional regulator [Lactobacillus nasalidis]GHV97146.1 transcriptional regulator [Lactobacillus nasalidis]GHV99133.1 transcriptional regulator [Lactobacillus nasalidis]GHW01395.1 transcriptional regulator [Lactobacillus nasalidis]
MFIQQKITDRIAISHDFFKEEAAASKSSDFHLELVELLSPCHAVLNNLPCQLDSYDIVISKKLPRLEFFNREPFSLRLVSLDFKRQSVIDMLTMANNGLVHDVFKDLDGSESYIHYTGLDNLICHEALNFCQKIAEDGEDDRFLDYELSLACAGFLTELSRHYHARVRLDSSRFPSSNVHYTNSKTRTGMIMNYLVANIQDVTLEKMAEYFGYQPKYLSRLIRQLFDQTFTQLKMETRVAISKSLLELTTKSIEEISEIVGYPSVTAYYRAFKQVAGMTPSEYRKFAREG